MVLLIFGGLLAWGFLLWQLDRPSVPAWKTRNTYRSLNLLLVLLLMACAVKLTAYRVELRSLISTCR